MNLYSNSVTRNADMFNFWHEVGKKKKVNTEKKTKNLNTHCL